MRSCWDSRGVAEELHKGCINSSVYRVLKCFQGSEMVFGSSLEGTYKSSIRVRHGFHEVLRVGVWGLGFTVQG